MLTESLGLLAFFVVIVVFKKSEERIKEIRKN